MTGLYGFQDYSAIRKLGIVELDMDCKIITAEAPSGAS
jgi:hypothetical protein